MFFASRVLHFRKEHNGTLAIICSHCRTSFTDPKYLNDHFEQGHGPLRPGNSMNKKSQTTTTTVFNGALKIYVLHCYKEQNFQQFFSSSYWIAEMKLTPR